MASKAIGFLNFKFSADLTAFERAMNKAQKKLKKFGKNVTKAGQNLSRNLTLPILGLGAAALKLGSDFQETDAKFKTVFSSIQKEAEKTAQSLKQNFGLSELAAKEMLSGTGDLLVGFGFTEKKALELSNSVNELAVDLASFTNFSGGAKGASEALTKALLGERESIKSLGIAITETDLKKYAADQNLVWKELDRVTKAQLTFEMAQKQSSKAIGDFERTSGSFANQMRILQGDLVDIGSEMGARLIPYAQAFIEKLKGLAVWFDGLTESQKDNIVKWGLILAAIGPVLIIIGKMSIGIGALIGAFKGLAKFLVANPYIVFAAAITGVVFALGNWIEKAWGVSDAQRSINEVMDAANKAILTQQTEVNILTGVLKNENSTLEDKETALNKLKELAPEYYGKLNAATLDVVALDTATKNYTESIKKQALAEAGRSKLVELSKELIDLQSRQKEVNKLTESLSKLGVEEFNLGVLNLAGEKGVESKINSINEEIKAITSLVVANEQLGKSQKKSGGFYSTLSNLIPTPTPTTTPTPTPTTDLSKEIEKLEEPLSKVEDQFKGLVTWKHDFFKATESPVEDQFKDIIFWTQELTEAQKAHNATIQLMDDIMFSAAMSAANSQEDFFKSFIENIKKAIKQLLIQLAVMTVINLILGGPTMTIAKAFSASKTSVLGLAEGGLVTGPTTALIGEGVGTTASNPEVVAPLDKLKSMIGDGNQNIIVEGVLKGNDIYLSNKNTSINRLRTT
tara:strand:+ start:207 stop:2435 length:2229 start_codon:yes stop_codon:yes gene_type:complete